jgi:hypothetical protein
MGVRLNQRRQSRRVDMIRVLVCDQDGVQPGDSLETMREGPGIKEHASVVELGK